MSTYIKIILNALWFLLFIYWLITSISSKRPANKESPFIRFILYWLPLIFACYLLGPGDWFGHTLMRENFVPHTDAVGLTGLAFCTAGVIIACWARYLLGKNWSLSVQKKEEHELISTGIYKVVRHPIYTGLVLMFFGNALIVGDWRGLIAVAIVLISFLFKLKKEEKWLTEVFGDRYTAYKSHTKMLIPWLI
ncbi:MAG: putative protein-S-isoprenylcysteine methyltransferase [Bacteroidetes bacterium]|nr:putative protein-S-isoprenylcysteine methyltransferase [Bacteroidota bacterium]